MYNEENMQISGIKDLQINPAVLTRSLEENSYAIITKRSKPNWDCYFF